MSVTAEMSPQTLCGWGRTALTTAMVCRPIDADSIQSAVLTERRGVIARGLGRSYGDAAQCSGGLTIDMAGISRIGELDASMGTIEVGGGVSLHALLRHIVPLGWFVWVTPGTRFVSVGGAIAADVHGKNHHRDSSFARHVVEITLVTPMGTVAVSPDRDSELFWATAGGMGLTGVITSATLRLIPIQTSWMQVDTQRFSRIQNLMSEMERTDETAHYSVAWLDCNQDRGANSRSVLTRGEHAPSAAIPYRLRERSREAPTDPRIQVRRPPPIRIANRLSVRVLNDTWFHASSESRGSLRALSAFFHPLDSVGRWNLLYGPDGFVQYQFAVPSARPDVIESAVRAIGAARVPSFLAVLKRFGPGTPGPLSFSQEGWTLALDFPIGPPRLPALLDHLDDEIAAAGGRVYLAKDARLRPELLSTMYPRVPDMIAVRRRVDPDGVLVSDLSRRLGLSQ